MQFDKTLNQMLVGFCSPRRAEEIGQLAYMQWLGALPGAASYEEEAVLAYLSAVNYRMTDPPVAVFCRLIEASLRNPLKPLDLSLPTPRRRGGAAKRRAY
ncbi:hypothetical protein [Cognatishimia sp. F0-27]|uniref:hypothetical protein n=1 Tax=Cognatishimia sp. F0-27 TaxID=2816855 RepID=UPI001D0C53B6|nr:hypothetical protein [Cognatishimia sp. F0-27]MCC1491504.1 hypothetical protein [Cognatishimia sp. F0-27]